MQTGKNTSDTALTVWDTKWPPWNIGLQQLEKKFIFDNIFKEKFSAGGKQVGAKIRAHISGLGSIMFVSVQNSIPTQRPMWLIGLCPTETS